MIDRLLFLLFSYIIYTIVSQSGVDGASTARGLLLFKRQIECTTNSNANTYIGYGCYCGIGGWGNPVDDIDRCCQLHDQCYKRAAWNSSICGSFPPQIYFVNYKSICDNRTAICEDEQPSLCGEVICDCDAVFANCIKSLTPDRRYIRYSNFKCKLGLILTTTSSPPNA